MTEQERLAQLEKVAKTIDWYVTQPPLMGAPNLLDALLRYQHELLHPGAWHWVRHFIRKYLA